MEDQKKHIDDLFRQQLNDYQEAPRAGMWDRIEDGLDKIDTTTKPGNKNTGGSRGFMGYSIALLLIAAAAFFIFKQSHKQSLHSATGNKPVTVNSIAVTKEETTNDKSKKELNNAAKTTTSNTNNVAANTAPATGKSANITTSGRPNAESMRRAKTKSYAANTVAVRKAHHAAHSTSSVNNNNIAAADQPDSKDKASDGINAKAEDNTAMQPSAKSAPAKAVANKSKALNKVAATQKQKEKTAVADQISGQVTNTKATKVSRPSEANANKKKHTALAKMDNVGKAVVAPAGSLTVSEKNAGKKDAGVKKGSKGERHVDKEVANADKKVEKVNRAEENIGTDNNKQIAKAEKKTQMPVNNESAIIPEGKPVAANKNEAKEILKQKIEDSKQEGPAKNTADTSTANNNDKDNATTASGIGGSDDIAHQSATVFNLQAGVKLGYEQGFSQYTTSKFLGAVYAQIGLSDKFAIMLQPAVKYTELNNDITNSGSYYKNTGKVKDSVVIVTDSLASYHYYGTYDSIIVKRSISNTSYIGFEIPVLLKYKISRSFSLLGGINIDISNLFAVSDNINTIHLSTPTDSTGIVRVHQFNPFFDTLTYKHPGTPYSSYVPASSGTQATVRLGYMFGVDYSLADKFTLEFLVTQSLSGYNNISDKNIKSLYSQPYFRLSVGYRFLNITRKKPPYNGGL